MEEARRHVASFFCSSIKTNSHQHSNFYLGESEDGPSSHRNAQLNLFDDNYTMSLRSPLAAEAPALPEPNTANDQVSHHTSIG